MFRLQTIGVTLTILLSFVGLVRSDEELRVTFPDSLVQQFNYTGKAGVIFERPSMFGIPFQQTSISGPLVLSPNLTACIPLPQSAAAPAGVPSVLYVDRGICSFTMKARNAQNAGYRSMIVGDDRIEPVLPYMADDGSSPPITMPAVIISYTDARTLKAALASSLVIVSITYSMPNPDNRVEWDLWTTSTDPPSSAFKHSFGRVVQALGNSSLFTPRMYTINGHTVGCDRVNCGNQCSNGGLYCAIDPERDPRVGISGKDVIQENVRQLCLFQLLLNRSDTAQYLWFDYVTKFDSVCGAACPGTYSPYSTADPTCLIGFSSNCSYAVMESLNISSSLVKQCVTNSRGTESSDGHNTLLDAQITTLADQGVYYIPTLIINNAKYVGSLACGTPTDSTNCGPINAICSGFAQATEPPVCVSLAQGCDIGKVRDVCNVCGGDGLSCTGCDGVPYSGKVRDVCNVCGGNGTSCLGCDGIANSGKVKDVCGVCGGDSSSCKGCDGVPNSGKVRDVCNVCGGDGTSCLGCDGIANSKKVKDVCNVCGGNGTSCLGCDGVPYSGKVRDACNVCGGDGASCMGCDGVPNSKVSIDSCGVCGGSGTRLGSCLSTGSLAAIFTATIVGVVVAMFAVWCYMRRQMRIMRDDFNSMLHQYVPMEREINSTKNRDTSTQRFVDDHDI